MILTNHETNTNFLHSSCVVLRASRRLASVTEEHVVVVFPQLQR